MAQYFQIRVAVNGEGARAASGMVRNARYLHCGAASRRRRVWRRGGGAYIRHATGAPIPKPPPRPVSDPPPIITIVFLFCPALIIVVSTRTDMRFYNRNKLVNLHHLSNDSCTEWISQFTP